ncbi:MAG TPA: heavy metal-associated domain-containing protein [Candidatus Acidoferrales bacterium]
MQQHLQRQSGVQKAEVSLRDGTVQITPKEDGQIDPAQLLKATYDSGVTVAEMDVTAEGHVVKDASGALAFQVEPNRSWVITPNDQSRSLAELAGTPSKITVTGQLYLKSGKKKADQSVPLKLLITQVQKRE